MTVSGESGDVSGATVDSWKERLPHILEGYRTEDIWNLDETGCFWKALPDKGFGQRAKECKGGKKSKQRMAVTLIVNAAGAREVMPIIIWKSKMPCENRPTSLLYFSQKKAWKNSGPSSQKAEHDVESKWPFCCSAYGQRRMSSR